MGFFTSIRNLFRGDAQPDTAAQETGAGSAPLAAASSCVQAELSSEQEALTVALRQAEPRLSAWLAVVLEGVEKADDRLWARIVFLLRSLEAPPAEVDAFIAKFRLWLDDMEYERLEDFKSELQYRLALALDLEDEEDERSRLMLKLSEGLAKTREQISRSLNVLFASGRAIDESFWEELEEILIMADVGFETAHALTERLRRRAGTEGIHDAGELREAMRLELLDVFKPVRRISVVNPPEVVLMIGVNGVGKTTTIAKLCHRAVLQGKKVLLVAGDTFRAAAIEQLEIWAKRAGAGFYAKGHGADPAAVAYEAIDQAVTQGYDMVFVDTAGRLHTKVNLMEELQKVARVLGKRHPGAPHRTILVLDATTGQNALSQVKLFNEACGIDELVLTKLDGTAKGGIAVAVAMQYGIPISFIGLGEKMDDLRPFDPQSYVSALLGLEQA
ncbi:MAG: signal recognition particle-docking protein FtsY [Desulfovibrionaceae bacterium]|nr:signal recognition particle-docking protein FtsY [Desulfovibrionaceae bacterium]